MKPAVLSALLIFYFSVQAFCSGNLELVNEREIETDNINDIKIIYASEKVSIYTGTSEKLVIKEYMSENNSRYYANINITGNTLTVEKGESPIRLFNNFNRRVEVYLPVSYRNAVNIKTSSGSIDILNLNGSRIELESSSGRIFVNSITAGVIKIKSSSGGIDIGAANGNLTTETSSGNISLGILTGSFNAKTSSGGILCTVSDNVVNIILYTLSGAVRLYLPQSLNFNFSSRTSSGRLTAPFSDKLSSPVTDKNLVQGVIGGSNGTDNIPVIDIRTNSGSIRIEWAE